MTYFVIPSVAEESPYRLGERFLLESALPNETERELDAQIEKIEQLIANKIEAEITKNITE
jgi:hypothetical protein